MNSIRILIPVSALALAAAAHAQSFTYTTADCKTTITGFSAEPSGAVTVPATLGGYMVTEIGRAAFKDRTGITSVTFASGASVTKIGAAAFQGCTGLQSISLPSGTATLPQGVLQGCTALSSVTIPSTVTGIGPMAFAGCASLAGLTLPSSLGSIGESAFSGCMGLTTLVLPSGVTTMPEQMCNECRALASITLAGSVTAIGNNAFYNCFSLATCAPPSTVASLGTGAFANCPALTSLGFGASLASIGDGAFLGCSSLASISVASGNTVFSSLDGVLFNAAQSTLVLCPPGRTGTYAIPETVTTLAAGAFAHCSGLNAVTLPTGLAGLPDDAFYYATGLTALPLGDSLTSRGSWSCGGLKSAVSAMIPASITTIADDAFHADSSLAWVLFDANAPATVGAEIFDNSADGFVIYYYSSTTGFTSPEWNGYPAVALGIQPALVEWLVTHGYSPGTSLLSDANNAGVNLLTAYALGLDPALNLAASLPVAVVADGSLSLTFQGDSSGVSYGAQTSTDLADWTTSGVILSDPDAQGRRTASVPVTTGSRFLRLVFCLENG